MINFEPVYSKYAGPSYPSVEYQDIEFIKPNKNINEKTINEEIHDVFNKMTQIEGRTLGRMKHKETIKTTVVYNDSTKDTTQHTGLIYKVYSYILTTLNKFGLYKTNKNINNTN